MTLRHSLRGEGVVVPRWRGFEKITAITEITGTVLFNCEGDDYMKDIEILQNKIVIFLTIYFSEKVFLFKSVFMRSINSREFFSAFTHSSSVALKLVLYESSCLIFL